MFTFLAVKCNWGTNAVTERLQSVSLLLGEFEKASFQKSKAGSAPQCSYRGCTPGFTPHLPLPHTSPTSMVTGRATEERVPQNLGGQKRCTGRTWELNTWWPGAGRVAEERKPGGWKMVVGRRLMP